MTHRSKIRLSVTLGTLACLATGIWFWRQGVVAKKSVSSTAAIRVGVSSGDFVSARAALSGLADPALRQREEREIRAAELKQALGVRDTGMMRQAIGKEGADWMEPELLESADLELAREAVQLRDFKSYQESAEKWRNRSAFPGQWVLLEADQLLARKLPADALALLKNADLTGTDDALRQARLALLEAKEPWKAMATIDEGLKADPRNADLLSFRGQIEEAAGRLADARLDYVAAVLSERRNPLHRDVLANFYLRGGDIPAAAETWRDAAVSTGLGVYALKSWFWSRVSGVPLTGPLPPCRGEGWNQLGEALNSAPRNTFWTESLENACAGIRGADKRPEIIWLKLLESIRVRNFVSARKQLESGFPREAERLWPDLSLRLLTNLVARDGEDPRPVLAGRNPPSPGENAHPFVIAVSQWCSRSGGTGENTRFETWLAKPQALVGTLLASGWAGAALIVGDAAALAPEPGWPDWFDYGYAKSLLVRDGRPVAREWLESLPARSTAADLLLGEIQLTTGSVDAGVALLGRIAGTDSPHASRAAWTLALTELDRGHPAKARAITLANPSLAASVQGREILARAALAEGSKAETQRIYQELGENSTDAMIYLSKGAFAAGDFEQARRWTGNLARRFPEQPAFRQNLIKIDEAEKTHKP